MSEAGRSRFSRPTAPERVLEIASELFYGEGINTVGVDRIAAEADASKATLYAHFGNKDGLVAAYLDRRSAVSRQQFKEHHDFFYTSEPYWPEQERQGGQRTWTAMIFLNEPEAGGETEFPKAAIKVSPRTGNMLVWNNLNIIGEPNYFSLHEGLPVAAGTKYIITKWHRERPWTYCGTGEY